MAVKVFRTSAVVTGTPGLHVSAVNVWHFDCDDALVTLQAVFDKIKDFYTSIATLYTSSSTIRLGDRVVAFVPSSPATPGVIYPVTPRVIVGTGGTSVGAPQVAMVVSWRTALTGPSFRGRTYLGPLRNTAVSTTTGQLDSTFVATVQTAASALIPAMSGAGGDLLLYSRKLAGTQGITSAGVNLVPDTQRRRAQ